MVMLGFTVPPLKERRLKKLRTKRDFGNPLMANGKRSGGRKNGKKK